MTDQPTPQSEAADVAQQEIERLKSRVEELEERRDYVVSELRMDKHAFDTLAIAVDSVAFIQSQRRRIEGALARIDGTMPESVCHRCGGNNVVWFAPNEIWNQVDAPEDILCPSCFVISAELKGITPTGWRLAPEDLDLQAQIATLTAERHAIAAVLSLPEDASAEQVIAAVREAVKDRKALNRNTSDPGSEWIGLIARARRGDFSVLDEVADRSRRCPDCCADIIARGDALPGSVCPSCAKRFRRCPDGQHVFRDGKCANCAEKESGMIG